jgi:hypothetical protein
MIGVHLAFDRTSAVNDCDSVAIGRSNRAMSARKA